MSFSYVNIEKEILQYWRSNNTFQKQIEKNKGKPKFTYFDGPPFATGLPHYGHIVASVLKDVIPRYKAMCGYDVPRKWCWDVHGLPIEFEIEKKLGIKTKKDVLDFGIDKYNEECRSIVMKYSEEWKSTIERIGRWVDMENNIKTMDKNYMNGVWWVFQNMWQNDLVYDGVKVMPYSTGCATPLSNFEAKSNYRKINDPSITVKFPINENTFFLVWTTTPWTLPSNLALCVHPDLEYAKVFHNDVYYILLSNQLQKYGFSVENIQEIIKGVNLIGTKYQPLYPYFQEKYVNAFHIIADNYVKDDNGTGVVHQAPAFGEDDYRICLANNIINKMVEPPCPFDANGVFTDEVDLVKNMYFKDADKVIMRNLTERELMFEQKWESHEYPFCWRSNKPLMYRIVPCTFINVEKIKDKIIRNNREETNWVPSHLKDGRFGNWLEEAKDWCVSRNRFWGTPIPIWKSDDGQMICVDSSTTLEKLANLPKNSIKDMHRHHIDKIIIEIDGKKYRRIEEVFDCWFESGSLPFASQNFPYSYINSFNYPADYIAEGIDQTRGWFYTLMVIGTAVFDKAPFKNVIVNGLVLADDGEKMSKSKKNYPDPTKILEKYGADALRLYLIGTQIVKGESLKFRESCVANVIKNIHQFAFNTLTFLQQMIPLYELTFGKKFRYYNFNKKTGITNIMDIMLLNYLQEFINDIHREMETYYLGNIVERIEKFISQLSRTYLNMNKSRLKSQTTEKDAIDSLNVVFYTMGVFSIMIAPFAPFMAEYLYQKLYQTNNSVHLKSLPRFVWETKGLGQEGINLIESIIAARGEIRTIIKSAKKPVLSQTIYLNNSSLVPFLENIKEILERECNTQDISISNDYKSLIKQTYKINLANMGKRFKKNARKIQKQLETYLEDHFEEFKLDGKIIMEYGGEQITFKDEIDIIDEINSKKIPENMHSQIYLKEQMIIVSDLTWNDQLENKYWIRVICRQIMNMRKLMGLIPTDKATFTYNSRGARDIILENKDQIINQIGMDNLLPDSYEKSEKFSFQENDFDYDFCIYLISSAP